MRFTTIIKLLILMSLLSLTSCGNVNVQVFISIDDSNSQKEIPVSTNIIDETTYQVINFDGIKVVLKRSEQEFQNLATYEIVFGDLDADGDLDAVFANMKFNNSRVWLKDGKGFFEQTDQFLTMQGHGVALADLDIC